MHTANGLELMGPFRHAAVLFVHTLYDLTAVLHHWVIIVQNSSFQARSESSIIPHPTVFKNYIEILVPEVES